MPRPAWDSLMPGDLVEIEIPEGKRYWVRIITNSGNDWLVAAASASAEPGTYTIARGRDELVRHMPGFFSDDALPSRYP